MANGTIYNLSRKQVFIIENTERKSIRKRFAVLFKVKNDVQLKGDLYFGDLKHQKFARGSSRYLVFWKN